MYTVHRYQIGCLKTMLVVKNNWIWRKWYAISCFLDSISNSIFFQFWYSSLQPHMRCLACIFYWCLIELDPKAHQSLQFSNDWSIKLDNHHIKGLSAKSNWYYLTIDFLIPKYGLCYMLPDHINMQFLLNFFIPWVLIVWSSEQRRSLWVHLNRCYL